MKEQKRNKEFDKKIIECIQKNLSFFAWQSINGAVEKCELRGVAFRSDYGEIELEVRGNDHSEIQKIISGNRKISIYIPEMAMSFEAPLKNLLEQGKIKITIPEDYSIHERRKHERVFPEQKCFVSLNIKSQIIKKGIYDLSMGGFAFIVPKIERLAIVKDGEIINAQLELAGLKEKINCKLICTSSFSFDRFKFDNLPYGGHKFSFCFKEMNPDGKKRIQEYIVSELLLKESRKKAN